MSELINNRDKRRELLRDIVMQLHNGRDAASVKEEFRNLLGSAGATEIAQMENDLIESGVPEAEVKRLCDVHVAIFEESLQAQTPPDMTPGHPVHTFRAENEALKPIIEQVKAAAGRLHAAKTPGETAGATEELRGALTRLRQVERHYTRKEHVLFPYLEKHGIKGPSSVMWALHDDARAGFRKAFALLDSGDLAGLDAVLRPLLENISSMIYKETNILFPMALETLTYDEWLAIKEQSDEVGYTLIQPGNQWPTPAQAAEAAPAGGPEAAKEPLPEGLLPLSVGALRLQEIDLLLKSLPVDLTFVDKDDAVRYYSAGRERIFTRTPAIIGRKVQDCHPPASVHVVERIINDFRQGKRDVAEFWIQSGPRFVHIRYFALRDAAGAYQGTLEVTQDVTGIRQLTGERRLLQD
jgi:DUF438 domain-containing protein